MVYTPETLTEEFKKFFAGNLRSVVLYGSAVSGNHHKEYSDFNILVMLEQLDMAAFQRSAKIMRAWTKAGNPIPLIFTRDELRRCGDVFPLELMDIQDHRRVLYGEDPLASFNPNTQNLHFELERDLRSNLLKLRQAYWLASDAPKKARELMIRSSSTFLVLFRGALRLFKVSPLPKKSETPQALSKRVPLDVDVFQYIERLKATDREALRQDPDPWMERLLLTIEKIIEAVDSWK